MFFKNYKCCIIGTGPAGLGAAIELKKNGIDDIIMIDRNKKIGGLSRTDVIDGIRYDVGPHRFYTNSKEINRIWHETLGKDFIPVNRLTRIYYKNKYFLYPINAIDSLSKLGLIESLYALFSFVHSKTFHHNSQPATFENWVIQRFGKKLYKTFFKTYTEKVWGISCDQIGAEWAAQRIKGLDIMQIINNALLGSSKKNKIKTLVENFNYPILGAGQMYEAMTDNLVAQGVEILLDTEVVAIHHDNYKVNSIDVITSQGNKINISAEQYFSSIPMTRFFKMLHLPLSEPIQTAADTLYFRDHITVDLLVNQDDLFPDQWIYIHSPDVKMVRLANYKNFSKAMGCKNKTPLSVEYFVFQHENIWKYSDESIQSLAIEELEYLGIVKKETIEKANIVRETETYPSYFLGFQEPYKVLKKYLDQFINLCPIGRGGLYKYNNQDHSILSGLCAARNYIKLKQYPYYNIWDINTDSEYEYSQA